MTADRKNIIAFVWIMLGFNVVFIACYFSGISVLQQFIAPTINKANFQYEQMREFGVLEMTQNAFLMAIVYLLFKQVIVRTWLLEKIFYLMGAVLFIFIFIEEIDYGLHFYKYFSGELSEMKYFSWHNQWDDGVERATKVKKLADLVGGIWFVILPLVFLIPFLKPLKSKLQIIPTHWFIYSVIIALVCARLAHYFDDQGYGAIQGVQGNLHNTIAEFRETSMYYLYLLYAIQLVKTQDPLSFLKRN